MERSGRVSDALVVWSLIAIFGPFARTQAADFSQAGVYYQLCCDIDLNWQRVEHGSVRAYLDGAGFEIRSARLVNTTGFFGTIKPEGTIANLTLSDLDLGISGWDEREKWFSAGGMATENYGTIKDCAVTAWISTRRVEFVGGMVGYNSGSITNCCFEGWVSSNWEIVYPETEIIAEYQYSGGLAGCNDGTITSSYARSIVVGTEGLGGLVGENRGTIRNCYSWGMVIGGVGSGGLVARNGGSLQRCYTVGYVTGAMRGGLVGMAGTYSGTVSDCLWDISMTACPTSGAGVGVDRLGWAGPRYCSYNGWAGDPNWVVRPEFGDAENCPRLAWEGTDGEIIPEAEFFWDPGAGSGTESDPYVIEYPTQLHELCVASAFWDAHFVLAADLNMSSAFNYSPIGVGRGSSFSGTFDGNGHVIRNVRVDANLDFDKATVWNTGVFGYVTGEVRNLRVEDIQLEGGANSQCVGLLAGTSEGVIRNCSATGSIRVGEGSRFIGELIGYSNGEVTDCEARATIEAGEGSTEIGGLVGRSPRQAVPLSKKRYPRQEWMGRRP